MPRAVRQVGEDAVPSRTTIRGPEVVAGLGEKTEKGFFF